MLRALALILTLVLILAAAKADEITVFAAASMKTAMDEIAAGFTAESGHTVRFSYAGSSVLARQIQSGAPADIFMSANQDWMDLLADNGLIDPQTRFDLASNRLVLIGHGLFTTKIRFSMEEPNAISNLVGDGHLATALTDAVPLGIYARQALKWRGEWDALSPRIVQADNAGAALALVATGAADVGIVYASDAIAEPRVTVIAGFPAESHDAITYPVAAIAGRDNEAVDAFLDYLKGETAKAVLEAQGFGRPQ